MDSTSSVEDQQPQQQPSKEEEDEKSLWFHAIFQPLTPDLQANVLSFVTEAELWLLHEQFPDAVRNSLASKSSIRFSFLHRILPNSLVVGGTGGNGGNGSSSSAGTAASPTSIATNNHQRNRQQVAIEQLMALLHGGEGATTTTNLKRLECDSLRGVTGHTWLLQLPGSLQSLNLTGCVGLEPDILIPFLEQSEEQPSRRCQLKSLNLSQCSKLSNSVVLAIANHQTQLEELWLGGCSQSISNGAIHILLRKLTRLQHLDLQALNNISDLSGQFVAILPTTLKSLNLAGCQRLRLASVEALEGVQYHMNYLERTNLEHWKTAPISRYPNMMHLVLDSIGTPRVGLCRGVVAYFAMGRALREVHLTGCEHVQDWEVEALAVTCAATLTCFQMRVGPIGDPAVIALAKHCQLLSEVDLSACFQVTDVGVVALTEAHRSWAPTERDEADEQHDSKRTRRDSRLRVLRLARLPHLTDVGVRGIGHVTSLHVLDVRDCVGVSPRRLMEVTMQLPRLIEVHANNIRESDSTYLSLLRASANGTDPNFPVGLCLVNGRYQSWDRPKLDVKPLGCCSVRIQGQRLDKSTHKAVMYHCIDCNLIPSVDRGICASCISKCHRGHRTFVGSWVRFYCDCSFGCAGNECVAVFPSEMAVPEVLIPTTHEGSGEDKDMGTSNLDKNDGTSSEGGKQPSLQIEHVQ